VSNGCTGDGLCGCCAGTSIQTPQATVNLAGLPAVSRRVGTWATFKESFLARLSSSDYPALAGLKTRTDDDFTVAFLDASAMLLDILTFYQERLNNESYLRTAGQLRSLTELSRLLGYQPAPGASASTYLAFTLKSAPGLAANPAVAAVTIPAGTQVQSVPAQGQTAQTFETSADIAAKADWTALAVQTTQTWVPQLGDTSLYLSGITTQLNPGDAILIVGQERSGNAANNNWDVRTVLTVSADPARGWTRLTWHKGLGWSAGAGGEVVLPAQKSPKVYALRQRAALFGYNAIDPNLLSTAGSFLYTELVAVQTNNTSAPQQYKWAGFELGATIDLDAAYPKITPGSWVVLATPATNSPGTGQSAAASVTLSQVMSVSLVARSGFGLSARISRITPDNTAALAAPILETLALAQSEELPVADPPLTYPLYGNLLDLADLRPDLSGASVVAVSGTRQKIAVTADGLIFVPDDASQPASPLLPGAVLTLISPGALPSLASGSAVTINSLPLEDANGRTGTVQNVSSSQFVLAPSAAGDPQVSEYALVSFVGPAPSPYPHTQLQLANPLANCYDRTTTSVNANVGPATQGRTVSEIMGSGNASVSNQSFVLKQTPLTFVQASTPSGIQSTLQVRVNSVLWSEVPSLYAQGPSAPVFATLNQTDATTEVLFGDGTEAALLPTGQNNLQATYRVGLGAAGNVGSGTLTTLMDRPLGVSGVTNPQAATGGQDAQGIDDIRSSAPLTVLTLGRAVSITDYQNYARTFAGISKAYAIWIPSGPGRGVFLTVAGVDGAVLPFGDPTLSGLFTSLQAYGNPLIPITVASYVETLFRFAADLCFEPSYDQGAVRTAARQAVAQAFGFSARSLGQGVSADEVAAVIQGVPGIVAVNITQLWRTQSSGGGDISQQGSLTITQWNAWLAAAKNLPRLFPDSPTQLYANLPVASALSPPTPAEILVLDPNLSAASWGVMS
jgi:hypothetical protein